MGIRKRKSWLDGAVGYEIYTRSFMDSTGDGFGDLQGITGRLEYLAWLGIDIVWLTPIYPSPDHDHGYDVADYMAVRAEHGTVADVEALVDQAHSLGLRVLLDIVPNHTSSEHRWFKTALSDPDSAERSMYLFRDAAADGGPPNNWISHFGGPAWTLDEASGQYYCHLFLPEQPDLDWRSPLVLDGFDEIYRFWFELGIDGFRIDVAHGLLKHPSFADNPRLHEAPDNAGPLATFFSFDHKFDMDQDENIEIFGRWQAIADEYDATLVAESGVTNPHRLARYVGPDALDLSFFLKPSWLGWEPAEIIRQHLTLADIEPDGISWVISNHDNPRPVSRFVTGAADPQLGLRRSLAVTTLQMVLGGVPFLYYGDELGLSDAVIDPAAREDPLATRNDSDGG
ncbi:MAG: alpha-amylase family glycosyl hydrolase, partial [Acidimicrobiales bacterium]